MVDELKKEELLDLKGGAIRWGIIGAFASVGVFIAGLIDGILRPLPCKR